MSAAEARRRPRSSARSASAMPDSDVAIASGRLNARKSVSGSGRSTRNGRTTRRVSACASARRGAAVHAADGAKLLGHGLGRRGPFRGPLGQRAADHAVHRRDGRGAGERRRLLVQRRVQDLDDRRGR